MVNLELSDGSTAELTLRFDLLYKLKQKNPVAYAKYFNAINGLNSKTADQTFLMTDIIYVGYACGLLAEDKLEQLPDYEAFLALLPDDITQIFEAGGALIRPNRKKASEKASEKA